MLREFKYKNYVSLTQNNTTSTSANKADSLPDALFIVDGKKLSRKDFDNINPSFIESIHYFKRRRSSKAVWF